jgi:undecaprenyl-diphosphatase
MNIFEMIILSLVQGLTEWLPISSSGHIVIAQQFLKLQTPLIVNITLHFGTLISALVFFRDDIRAILIAILKMDFKSAEGKYSIYIIVGNLPIFILGLSAYDTLSSAFTSIFLVSISLLITGVLLYISKYGKKDKQLNALNCLLIGLAQAIALIPGISRSGVTIATGRLLGVNDEKVFKFSFLLAIPAIIGANVFELFNLDYIENIHVTFILTGVVITASVGYLSLKLLYQTLIKGKFHLFSLYCWGLGIILFLINLTP